MTPKNPYCLMFIILIVNLCCTSSGSAQDSELKSDTDAPIKKGTFIIGSYFNFSTLNTSRDRIKGFDTQTSNIRLGGDFTAGKMISNHWGFIVNLGYTSTSSSTPQVNGTGASAILYNLKSSQSDFVVMPALRYYKVVSDGYYLFIQTSAHFSFGSISSDEFDKNDNLVHYDFSTTGFGMGISPGLTYFMTKKLSTEISIGILGFSVLNGKDNYGNKTQTTNFQSLFYQNSVSLGFVYYL
jgi:hypothetical protein